MKQLKFFTQHVDILRATREDLARQGILPKRLHICTNNSAQCNDADVKWVSSHEHQTQSLSRHVCFIVALLLIGTIAVAMQWLSFTAFSLVFLASVGLFTLISKYLAPNIIDRALFEKVYCLVVDVHEYEEELVNGVIRNHPGLQQQPLGK